MNPDRPIPKSTIAVAVGRVLVVIALLLGVYALLPLKTDTPSWGLAIAGVVGMGLLVAAVVWSVPHVMRSERPVTAALESLALVFGGLLVDFALVYVTLSADDPANFTQPINKVAGIYFSMTVLTTVGFGDIAAVSDTARIVVTLQMAIDVVLIALVVKMLTQVTQAAIARRGNGVR